MLFPCGCQTAVWRGLCISIWISSIQSNDIPRLRPSDHTNYQLLCQQMLVQIIFEAVSFSSDKSIFTSLGHNFHYWSENNPRIINKRSLHSPNLTLMCAVLLLKGRCNPGCVLQMLNGNVVKFSEALNGFHFLRVRIGGCVLSTGWSCSFYILKFIDHFEKKNSWFSEGWCKLVLLDSYIWAFLFSFLGDIWWKGLPILSPSHHTRGKVLEYWRS